MTEPDKSEELLDQFMDEILRGEAVDVEAFLAEHPELSETQRRKISRVARVLQPQPDSSRDPASELPREQLGPYRLLRPLGQGGMGMVYLAEQNPLGRQVALKLIRPVLASSAIVGRRFRREAMAVAQLQHPHIVTIYDAGEEDGFPYLVMEYVPGRGLDEILREAAESGKPLPVREVLQYVQGIASALDCAHQAGIIHRDVKPSNIRITPEGRPMLLDFGLARGGELPTVSSDDRFRGTPFYASPEQVAVRRTNIDARTDIYSLGVTLYESVTGEVPFRGETTEQLFHQILVRSPRFPRKLNPSISRDLEAVILKAMEKDAGRRYASAQEFADDLEALLEMRPVKATPANAWQMAAKWTRQRPAAALAMLFATILLIGGPLGYAWLSHSSKVRIQAERDAADEQRAAAVAAGKRLEASLDEVLRLSDVLATDELLQESDALWPRRPALLARFQDWLGRAEQVLARRPEHERTRDHLRTRFEEFAQNPTRATAPEALRWQLATTEDLLQRMNTLDTTRANVADRVQMTRSLQQSLEDSAEAWDEIATEIFLSELYHEYELEPQTGLVPLGINYETGLAEFWFVESGEAPEKHPDKDEWAMHPETGLILVLLPETTFRIGTRSSDELGGMRVPANEFPSQLVTLEPFFLSKYEFTQAQWKRFVGSNPSSYDETSHDGRKRITPIHPVENMSWDECLEVVQRLGLTLPTEAQWEYAARAGTRTAWWNGNRKQDLDGYANLVDDYCRRNGGHEDWKYETWLNDGFTMHSPVGTFLPNGFGLYDTVGNIAEWCLDAYGNYELPYEEGTGLRILPDSVIKTSRVLRGGSYLGMASECRSATRYVLDRSQRANHVGVRPAMRVERQGTAEPPPEPR